MPQSILNRGADTILNIGAWNDSNPGPDLQGGAVDNLVVTESIVFTSTPTAYPFPGLMRRGASEDTIHHLGLEIGAWQTPLPRVAGKMPDIPESRSLFIMPSVAQPSNLAIAPASPQMFGSDFQQNLLLGGGLGLYEMFVDDLTEIMSYKMQIIADSASDDYSDDFIKFNFYTKHILLTTWDNPVDVILTRHGQENFYIAVNGFGFLKKLAVRGFKIKNSNPGFIARYQLVAFG